MKRLSYKKSENGFVALFAVLLTSVILAMAIGIASIAFKEIILSSSASEGTLSFYAADSGIECALFKDATTSEGQFITSFGTCNGQPIIDGEGPNTQLGGAQEIYTFKMRFGENGELCADITVRRQMPIGLGYNTEIESRGSNVPCGEESPRRVERVIRVTY